MSCCFSLPEAEGSYNKPENSGKKCSFQNMWGESCTQGPAQRSLKSAGIIMLTSRENDLNLLNVHSYIWGALCISQCNEMLVPQATVNNQGSIQHHAREDVHTGVWADFEGLRLVLNGHKMKKNQSLCSKSSGVCLICSSMALCDHWVCAGGSGSGGLLTHHWITVLDSNMSHLKNSPSLQALKIPPH